MLDHNNIEVMCLQLITLRVVSVDNTIAVIERKGHFLVRSSLGSMKAAEGKVR